MKAGFSKFFDFHWNCGFEHLDWILYHSMFRWTSHFLIWRDVLIFFLFIRTKYTKTTCRFDLLEIEYDRYDKCFSVLKVSIFFFHFIIVGLILQKYILSFALYLTLFKFIARTSFIQKTKLYSPATFFCLFYSFELNRDIALALIKQFLLRKIFSSKQSYVVKQRNNDTVMWLRQKSFGSVDIEKLRVFYAVSEIHTTNRK